MIDDKYMRKPATPGQTTERCAHLRNANCRFYVRTVKERQMNPMRMRSKFPLGLTKFLESLSKLYWIISFPVVITTVPCDVALLLVAMISDSILERTKLVMSWAN